jgi:hypothetical protein
MHSLRSTRLSRLVLSLAAGACLLAAGCSHNTYYPPPPPNAYVNPLIQQADDRGFHAGLNDGARDAANGSGYHPRRDRKYAETPGYDPSFGPYPPYRDAFRNAYLRGYSNGFNHR